MKKTYFGIIKKTIKTNFIPFLSISEDTREHTHQQERSVIQVLILLDLCYRTVSIMTISIMWWSPSSASDVAVFSVFRATVEGSLLPRLHRKEEWIDAH